MTPPTDKFIVLLSVSYSLTLRSILKFFFSPLSSIAVSTMSPARTRRTARNISNKRHELEDCMGPSSSSRKKLQRRPPFSRKVISKVQNSATNRSRTTTKSRQTAAQAARNGFALPNNKYTYCSCVFSMSKPRCRQLVT